LAPLLTLAVILAASSSALRAFGLRSMVASNVWGHRHWCAKPNAIDPAVVVCFVERKKGRGCDAEGGGRAPCERCNEIASGTTARTNRSSVDQPSRSLRGFGMGVDS
jgi:hypothetical protein